MDSQYGNVRKYIHWHVLYSWILISRHGFSHLKQLLF
uniref:Uncharacterized protein n=1 Tax=Arundo donax TaxID=35708 RepID=A0A0A9FRP8_ARUDO